MKNEISLMKRWMRAAAVAGLGLWAGPALAGSEPAPAASEKAVASEKAAEVPTEVAEEEVFNNWVEVGIGYNSINENDAQFNQRFGLPSDQFYGGIQDLHMEQGIGNALLSIDGRFIYDNMDNLIDIKYEDPDWGYVNVGYKEFRTWYDGSGGYYPGNAGSTNGVNFPAKDWFKDLHDDELHLDRGELWFEAGLLLPDLPQFTFRYTHDWRDGQKGSTIWGDSNRTGGYYQRGGRPFKAYGTRAYLPTLLDIDEVRDTFDLDVTHTIGNTDFGIGGRLELLEEDNARYSYRRPGEFGVKQEGLAATRYPVEVGRHLTTREKIYSDMWNAHGFTETRFNDVFTLTTGGSFTAMDVDFTGQRVYAGEFDQDYDAWYNNIQNRDEGYYDLVGGAFMKQYVGNVNLIITPFEHLTIVPAFRVEFMDRDSVSDFVETNFADQSVGAGKAKQTFSTREIPIHLRNMGTREDVELTESLEIRYSGVPDWVFYIRGEWSDGETHLKESEYELGAYEYEGAPFIDGDWHDVGVTELFRDTNTDRFMQKYVAGVNWYPTHTINLSAQYFYKEKDIDYAFLTDWEYYADPADGGSTGDLYPSFIREQDFQTHDLNVRLTWRPCSFMTSVSRYDLQHTTIDTRGDYYRVSDFDDSATALDSIETCQVDSHIFSQSLTVSPFQWMYIQGYGTFSFNEMETPVYGRELPGNNAISPATLDAGYLSIVGQSRNSYWNAGALLGVQIDDKTSFQCAYSFYQCDNWVDDSFQTMPYGSEGEEHTIMATVNREITRNIILTLRYGHVDYKDVTSDNNNSFDGHLAYAGMKFKF